MGRFSSPLVNQILRLASNESSYRKSLLPVLYRVERLKRAHWDPAGKGAAGILFTTGTRILLLERSWQVEDPGVWGISGGALDWEDRNAIQGAVRESREELGKLPSGYKVIGKAVFQRGSWKYTTFVCRVAEDVADSYHPTLNWENDDYGWFDEDDLSYLDIHPGVEYVLDRVDVFD